MARSKSSRTTSASRLDPDSSSGAALAAELSYSEAQTALDLALAELQSSDLAVEEMTALFQRAQAYAERCAEVLQQVEQTIELWDPQTPDERPRGYTAAQTSSKAANAREAASATETSSTQTRSTED